MMKRDNYLGVHVEFLADERVNFVELPVLPRNRADVGAA